MTLVILGVIVYLIPSLVVTLVALRSASVAARREEGRHEQYS